MVQNGCFMHTWVCPQCGSAVGVSDETCPRCSARGHEVRETAPPAPPPKRNPVRKVRRASASRAAMGDRGEAFNLRRAHYLSFAGAVVASILVAVWMSGGCAGLRLEEVPDEAESSGSPFLHAVGAICAALGVPTDGVSPVATFGIGVRGSIEVSGIRPYYDADKQMHVRAFVANHSQGEQSVALRVLLRVPEAGDQAPPLGAFDLVTVDPLSPADGQEFDVEFNAMGTLQSFPVWSQIRVDLEPLGARSD